MQVLALSRSFRFAWRGNRVPEVTVVAKTNSALARAIETNAEELIIVTDAERVAIPWRLCSERLAHATARERNCAELSSSGYGVHWPLIDEDLAVGPLLDIRNR